MNSKSYNVTFSGSFVEGMDIQRVKGDLARLFKVDVGKIDAIFKTKGAVIKRGVDHQTALKYINTLKSVGVICILQEKQTKSEPVEGATHAEPKKKKSGLRIRTISPQAGAGELAFSPVKSNRVTGWSEGINLNRVDAQTVLFQEIILVAVFKEQSNDNISALVFVRGYKRPFICESNRIAYSDFPGVKDSSQAASLRNLVTYLCSRNLDLILDESTASFMSGRPPAVLEQDLLKLTTALGNELDAIGQPSAGKPASATQRPTARVTEKVLAVPEKVSEQLEGNLTCPKCGAERLPGKNVCERCGLTFTEWGVRPSASQPVRLIKPTDQEKETPAPSPENVLETVDDWTLRWAFLSALMLIGAFICPLFRYSILFSSSTLVWPWEIMGWGREAVVTAATATFSEGPNIILWALLPVCAGAAILVLRRFGSLTARLIGMLLTGTVVLILMETVFIREGEILGLFVVPPTVAGGIMILIAVVAAALIAVANHLRKDFPEHMLPRALSGTGALIFGLSVCFAFLASRGPWKGWPMILLYIGMLLYALSGAISALQRQAADSLLSQTSSLARVILLWVPLACILAQRFTKDPFVGYVIGSAGGLLNIFVSVLKLFLIYYGSAVLMTMGLTGLLEMFLANRTAPQTIVETDTEPAEATT